jgi:hypothetical protein
MNKPLRLSKPAHTHTHTHIGFHDDRLRNSINVKIITSRISVKC